MKTRLKMGFLKSARSISLILILQVFSNLPVIISSTPSATPEPDYHECSFQTPNDKKHFQALLPIVGKTFTAEQKDSLTGKTYKFLVGICKTPCSEFDTELQCDKKDAVIQTWRDERQKLEKRVVGRFDDVAIQGSEAWKMMTYKGGDKYRHHCVIDSARRAHIMFFCDETLTVPSMRVLEENSQRNDTCYYLFEISGKFLCPAKDSILPEGVSAGSVIVILFAVGVLCYLVFGCLYRRLVVGAKGMDQMPNLEFWQNFGNLMADGCDYVFRTKTPSTPRSQHSAPGSGGGYQPVTSSPGSRVYKGLGDDILSNEDNSGGDDSLLPM